MRVIMTGGGTGGHVYPAIAIADKIMKEVPEAEILFVGTKRGIESVIVPNHGYMIEFIDVSGFNRKKLLKNGKALIKLIKGSLKANRIIKKFKPDMVIGTGGYVCGPVVKMAQNMGIKTYIHEQNAYPGLTNRMLEKNADKIFLGFKEAANFLKSKEKLVVSGNPVRNDFYNLDKNTCKEKLNIQKNNFTILAFGGSGGAGKINNEMLKVVNYFRNSSDVTIFFVTGRVYYKEVLEKLQAMDIELSSNLYIMEYINDIHEYMGASDLIIGRSGALTTAEINVSGRASILIPSPNVTGNHQYYNALAISENGGAILIEEKDLIDEKLISCINMIKANPDLLNKMEEASRSLSHKDATEIIFNSIINMNI